MSKLVNRQKEKNNLKNEQVSFNYLFLTLQGCHIFIPQEWTVQCNQRHFRMWCRAFTNLLAALRIYLQCQQCGSLSYSGHTRSGECP